MRRSFEEVYNRGDLAVADELAAPDFVSHDAGNPTQDPDGVKQIVRAIRAAFPDVRFTADDVPEAGDTVAVRFTMRGTQRGEFRGIPPTRKPFVVTGIDIVRFAAGRAAERWHEWSGLGLLQQPGALPALERPARGVARRAAGAPGGPSRGGRRPPPARGTTFGCPAS
jgi:predicted ester cyclase